MAHDAKYGEVTVENEPGNPLNGTDEPVFLLRARDQAALAGIEAYRADCRRKGSPQEHLDGITEVMERFAIWQHENAGLLKVPD